MTPDRPRPVLVLLSGGLNSVAAAMRGLDECQPHFLHVDHGQAAATHQRDAATRITQALAGTLHLAELPPIATLANSTSPERDPSSKSIPPPTPTHETRAPGIMLTMLGLAQQLAQRIGADTIVCGASELCNTVDPDARHIFHHAAQVALEMGSPNGKTLALEIPFIDASRADIIRVGHRLGAPFHLSWSCHRDGDVPCGDCRGCRSRSAAFDEVGLPDPRLRATAGRVVRSHPVG